MPRFFTTLPARTIADTRPTALDLRCLAVIALHDGMSKVSGKGGGCYAKHSTLASEVGTDVSNFSKSLSRLLSWGYVAREPQLFDKRRFTLRVIYDHDDTWRTDQPSPPEIVGEAAPAEPEIVGDAESGNGGVLPRIDRHYISLNEELHSDKSEELNSPKGRQLENCAQPDRTAKDFGIDLKAERDTAKAGLGKGLSLRPHLPHNILDLDPVAQLAKFEKAFGMIGRDADALTPTERESWATWLYGLSDDFHDDPIGQQAQRLYEEVAQW